MPRNSPSFDFVSSKIEMESRYRGATPGRFGSVSSRSAWLTPTADAMWTDQDRLYTIGRLREAHAEKGIVRQLTERSVSIIIQNGFTYHPDTGDEKLDEDLFDWLVEHKSRAEFFDVSGRFTFSDVEQMLYRNTLLRGDTVPIMLADGRTQIIEAERVVNPTGTRTDVNEIVHGFELSPYREIVAIHVMEDQVNPNKLQRSRKPVRVAVRDELGIQQVFHVALATESTLTRPIPEWAPMIDLAGLFDDTNFALVLKQQLAACLVYVHKKGKAALADLPHDVSLGERTERTTSRGDRETVEQIKPGMVVHTENEGEDWSVLSPNIASSETLAHMFFLIQSMGVGLGLPLVDAMLDGSKTNFSGHRGANNTAKLGYMMKQAGLISRWHRPWHEARLARLLRYEDSEFARTLRRLERRGAITEARLLKGDHKPPRWPYPQPLHDAEADARRVETGHASRTDIAAENGDDVDLIDRARASETRRLVESLHAEFMAFKTSHNDSTLTFDQFVQLAHGNVNKFGTAPLKSDRKVA